MFVCVYVGCCIHACVSMFDGAIVCVVVYVCVCVSGVTYVCCVIVMPQQWCVSLANVCVSVFVCGAPSIGPS